MFNKFILSFIILLINSTLALTDPWVKEFTKDGITVYLKNLPNSAFTAFRSETEIDAPIEKVNLILCDTKSQVRWMPDCIVSEIIKKERTGVEIAYSETKVPVVNNRDVLVETRIEITLNKIVHFFRALDRPDLKPELQGKVRIKDMNGKWELLGKGKKTFIIYEVKADPGGNIPAWLVNMMSKDMPYKTLLGLKRMAAGLN